MDEIRIESRIKNNMMWEAIVPVFGSVAEFCRRTGLNQCVVGKLMNFKASPFCGGDGKSHRTTGCNQGRAYTPVAMRLAEICGYSCEELFPLELYGKVTNPRVVRTISLAMLLAKDPGSMPYHEVEDAVERKMIAQDVAHVLDDLSARESEVIRRRLGIGCKQESMGGVARSLKVTRTRIQQIEEKGLRKLRHPIRKRALLAASGVRLGYSDMSIADVLRDKDNASNPVLDAFADMILNQPAGNSQGS